MFALDVSADKRVLFSADERGLIIATDLSTKHRLWSKQMIESVYALRAYERTVFVPVCEQPGYMLDMATGDVVGRFPGRRR